MKKSVISGLDIYSPLVLTSLEFLKLSNASDDNSILNWFLTSQPGHDASTCTVRSCDISFHGSFNRC